MTSSRWGVAPCSPSRSASAIEKQEEWAAAASSSGLVIPSGLPVRAAQLTGRACRAPLPEVTVPWPLAKRPLQIVSSRALGDGSWVVRSPCHWLRSVLVVLIERQDDRMAAR